MSFEKDTNESKLERWSHIAENVHDLTRPKTTEEIEVVLKADEMTSRTLTRYGRATKSVTPEKVFIIPDLHFEAFYSTNHDLIAIGEPDNLNAFKFILVHEMLHGKITNVLPYPLTEAIVERLTLETINAEGLSDKEIADRGGELYSGSYTHPRERKLFNSLINKVHEKTGKSDIHIFNFFASAYLHEYPNDLNFLNEIFVDGTLKRLMELDDNTESFERFVLKL